MKSLKNMPESLEKTVRLCPQLWKVLITGAMFWFLLWQTQAHILIGWKVPRDKLALPLNLGIFRIDEQT